MSEAIEKNNRSAGASAVVPRLFVLELNAGRIHSMNTDGSDRKTIVSDCHLPDGIVVDAGAVHIYCTNMGIPNLNDGSIQRADIDGKNRKTIVAQGDTHTPKQIILDKKGGKLYWCDREGMRVMRCNLDGTQLETLIEVGRGEAGSPFASRRHHWVRGSSRKLERNHGRAPSVGGSRPPHPHNRSPTGPGSLVAGHARSGRHSLRRAPNLRNGTPDVRSFAGGRQGRNVGRW